MTPLFLGSGSRRLFGIYETPSKARPATRAVLICQPWGPEYLYAHRALRQLATMLSAAGHHVFRFDYHGTGDSGGDMTSETLASWEGDTISAIAELRALSGMHRVTIVGLRLGAILAARAAATLPNGDVAELVLWDPITSGKRYVNEMFEACRAPHLMSGGAVTRPASVGGGQEVLGYPLTAAFQKDLAALDLASFAPTLTQRLFVVCSSSEEEHRRTRHALETVQSSEMLMEYYSGFPCWQEDWPVNVAIIPVQVLNRIVNWVG